MEIEMSTYTRTLAVVLAVLLVGSLFVPVAAAFDDPDDKSMTDLGTGHDLDTSDAIAEFNDRGNVDMEATRLDMTITLADSKDHVGLEDELTPTNQRNDFVRFEYNEEAERTVRILIPEEYWTPYLREEVQAIGEDADHVASYKSVRGGDYTAIVVRFDGPADVVFPVDKMASLSYVAVERVDDRLNNSVGFTIRDDDSKWKYVPTQNLTEGPGYDVGESTDDLTVQYDATPDSPEETWVNAPNGETFSDDIYYYERGAANSSAYIVSKTDDPPAVRYAVESSMADRIRGDVNELTDVPRRIAETLGGGLFG